MISASSERKPEAPSLTLDQKYNLLSLLIDSAGWPLGMAFFSTTTIVPAFLNKLGAGSFLIGLLPAAVTIGYNVPGVFVANHIERLPLVRSWLFRVALLERIPLLLIGVATLIMKSPSILLWSFLALYSLHSFVLGLNQPAYWVMVAKSVPTAWRGRLFGFGGLTSGLLGLAVLPITRHFLVSTGRNLTRGFGWCFVIGAVIELLSFLPLGFVREPVSLNAAEKPNNAPSWQRLSAIWRSSPGFRQFIWGQVFFSVWMIATPFYLVDGIHRLHVSVGQCGIYASIGVIVPALGGTVCGIFSDRKGNRLILLFAGLAACISSLYAMVAPTPLLLSIVFALSALGLAGAGLAGYNVTMEFAPTEQDVPHYTAFYNVVVSPIRALSMIVGGVLAQASNFSWLFIVSAVAAFLSVAVTYSIVEPRHKNISGRVEEPRL